MAITRVNSATGSGTGASYTITVTAPTNGNAMILTNNGPGLVTSVAQTGATWRQAAMMVGGNHTTITSIWYALNVQSAGTTITVTLDAAGDNQGVAVEYSGIATTDALDVVAGNGNSASTSTSVDTGTTQTTRTATELWVGAVGNASGTVTYSAPTNGFSIVAQLSGTSHSHAYLEKIVSATGTANTGATLSVAENPTGCIATFSGNALTGLRAIQGIFYRNAAAASSFVLTLPQAPNNGNAQVLAIGTDSTVTVSSVTQTGATWAQASTETSGANRVDIWYAMNASSAGTSVTVNLSGNSRINSGYREYAGVATASALDLTAVNTATSTTPDSGTTGTTNQNNELFFAAIFSNNPTAPTATTTGNNSFGFTMSVDVNAGQENIYTLEKFVTATGTANTGFTASASGLWLGTIATFKQAATGVPNSLMMLGIGS